MKSAAWVTVVCVAALLECKRRAWRPGEWALKPLASTGFVLSALEHGSLGTPYGRWVTAALCLSWWGDALLIPKSSKSFLAGLVAFLLGHVAYVFAFAARGVSWVVAALAFVVLLGPLALVGRWLMPKVPSKMKAPVMAYMAVITVMVACAVGTVSARFDAWVLLGALGFYGSDLAVANDRFVSPGFVNKLWGWPLYYGAQLVLAATVGR